MSLFYSGTGRQTITGGMPDKIEFEFLYTSEKQGWIEEITPGFEEWFYEKFGVEVKVRLIVGGTHETVNLILHGSVKPTAWSPASSIWIPYLNTKWRALGYGQDMAVEWTPLVISPVVIGAWKSMAEGYNVGSFRDLYRLALYGVQYKYGHTDPLLSNSGTMVVVLEFAEAAGKKPEELSVNDFKNETVLNFVKTIESRAVAYGKSTGFFGKWAVENGPSAISFFCVYENVILENSLKARKMWGDPIVAIYPGRGTLLSDHPFIILDADWVTPWQRFAAAQYLVYLLSPHIQEAAQKHGFRPANPSVPLDESIFNVENGVQRELQVPILKSLSGEALDALFEAWTKVRNPGTF